METKTIVTVAKVQEKELSLNELAEQTRRASKKRSITMLSKFESVEMRKLVTQVNNIIAGKGAARKFPVEVDVCADSVSEAKPFLNAYKKIANKFRAAGFEVELINEPYKSTYSSGQRVGVRLQGVKD